MYEHMNALHNIHGIRNAHVQQGSFASVVEAEKQNLRALVVQPEVR